MDFQQLLQNCDEDVRQGQAQRVAQRLSAIELARIPRELCLGFANVCRRASLISWGLKILGPVVRSEVLRATPQEQSEYAVLLQRNGGANEALRLLERVDSTIAPESNLFKAFCHFNLWQYEAALTPLKLYLATPGLAPYSRLVGQVNLAAAHISLGAMDVAEKQLHENIRLARELSASRLEGNCLELLAQIYIHHKKFAEARKALAAASTLLGKEHTLDKLFVRKWTAILDSLESATTVALETFREHAQLFSDWESLREVDLFTLKIKFDQKKFAALYCGTPFPAYREKILRELKREAPAGGFLIGNAAAADYLDIANCETTLPAALKPGRKVHQVLAILLKDFYRPRRVGELFAELYPDEFFNPVTSPARVHQLLMRTRIWLEQAGVPAEIRQREGFYDLHVNGEFAFKVGVDSSVSPQQQILRQMRTRFWNRDLFSSAAASRALGISESSFRRFARWAVAEGALIRIGSGSGTSYRLNLAHLPSDL